MSNFRKFFILFIFLSITACNLEDFVPSTKLNPPLNLVLTSSNLNVYLTFDALNEEIGFTGYNVFTGLDENTVLSMTTLISNENTNLPFAIIPQFSIASNITLVVSNDNNYNDFVAGHIHYFAVTAYDAIYSNNNQIYEVKSITISNL